MMMRCSVHSVRPVSEAERIAFEVSSKEDPTQWRSLADILPKRDYVDMVDEVPGDGEVEDPDLPVLPDPSTALIPQRRVHGKQPATSQEMITPEERQLRQLAERDEVPTEDINDYDAPEASRASDDVQAQEASSIRR